MSPHPVGERLSAYLDGELGLADRAEVEAHLRECASCSAVLEELAAVEDVARGLPAEPPPGYFDGFAARVRSRLQPARTTRRVPAWTWAAAAAVLLAVLTPLTLLERRKAVDRSAVEPDASLYKQQPATVPAEPAAVPPAATAAPPTTVPARTGTASGERRMRDKRAEPPSRLNSRDEAGKAQGQDRDAAAAQPEGEVSGRLEAQEYRQRAQEAPAAPPPPPKEALPSGQEESKAKREDEADTFASANKKLAKPAPRAGAALGGAAPAPPASVSAMTEKAAADQAADGFLELSRRPAASPEQARALARAWQGFVSQRPLDARADEARVRVVEAWVLAWRLSGDEADRQQARLAAEAYLRRPDAGFKDRVQARRKELER